MARLQHSIGMVKVTALIHRDYVDAVLHRLGELRCVQLTSVDESITLEAEEVVLAPAEQPGPSDDWSSLHSRVAGLIAALRIRRTVRNAERRVIPRGEVETFLKRADANVAQVEASVQQLQAEMAKLQAGTSRVFPRRTLKAKNLQIRLHEIAGQWETELLTISEVLEAQRQVEDAKQKMMRTGDTYLFEGWVPEDRLDETLQTIRTVSKGYGDLLKLRHPEELLERGKVGKLQPPTLLRYPRFTSVFEIFASLGRAFGLPGYYEIDPTIFFLVSFPIIFGMMYGDLGHGALLLVAAIGLYRLKNRTILRPGSISSYAINGSPLLILCAVSSIVFGVLYGEAFGSEEWFTALTGIQEPIWFSPIKNPNTLLRYSIYVGIAHVSFGLGLGLANRLLSRSYRDALSGPLVWLWMYAGGAYLVVRYGFGVFDVIFDPAVFGVFLAPPLIVMVSLKLLWHGATGLSEAIETLLVSFSHSVSYARILALKMVSSSFSALLLPTSIIGFVPFTIGTIALILIFETMLAFLHTLRLHWIEWFSKFYQGTGHPFTPFTVTREFTATG